MNYIGIDLHKQSISVCVVDQSRTVRTQRRLLCREPAKIVAFFHDQRPFEAVVEATASYEWIFKLLEPMAERMVLAHPGKVRIIAESTRKSDKLDALVLAELLAMDGIPEAHRPTPRQGAHRRLVRQRLHLKTRIRAVKCKIRNILADHNADLRELFTKAGSTYLDRVRLPEAERFILDQLLEELKLYNVQVVGIDAQLRRFARSAPAAEREARAVLSSIPYAGPVTVDVVCSELGDVRRFRSAKGACAYAGLAPGFRESGGHRRDLGITKQGSSRLRWVLVELAWRLTSHSRRWGMIFESLARRRGKKRAIVAVARRLLCVMVSMLKSGRRYRQAMV
jgi:transposase